MNKHLLFKTLSLLGVGTLLSIALGQVGGLVAERQYRQNEARVNVEASLAESQTLVGPVIYAACTEEWVHMIGEGKDRKPQPMRREFTVRAVPNQLDIDAQVNLEPRYRGIFKINSYESKTRLTAEWKSLPALRPQGIHPGSTMSCGSPALMTSVSDARGIRRVSVEVNKKTLQAQPGSGDAKFPRGFHVPLDDSVQADKPVQVSIELDLMGTADLSISPVGDANRVQMRSNWAHPSFTGRFLPVERNVHEQGFEAQWQVSGLASTAPRNLIAGADFCHRAGSDAERCLETFSVSFMDPVNAYSLSDRAIKYGLLFVVLTFVAVGLVEAMRKLRVHPIQYLLVGLALSLFFLLLLSLSEHLSFGLSYALAASACSLLLSMYGRYMLQGWGPGLGFGAGIASLFGSLYLLLQMEQTALVIGAVMLFAVLAGVMILTRNVDWYALLKADKPADPPKA
jgi:inner membrane protein